MGQNRRRAPAIFPRDGTRGDCPRPQFIKVGPPVEVVASANPVIPFIRGQWLGQRVEWLGEAVPRYQRFPYFDQSQQPGISSIPFSTTRPPKPEPASTATPTFFRLVPFQAAAVNATPPVLVIRPEFGAEAFQSRPFYFPFPHAEEVVPANAAILILRPEFGSEVTRAKPFHFPFPWFQQEAPASAAIPMRLVPWRISQESAAVGRPSHFTFPWFAQPPTPFEEPKSVRAAAAGLAGSSDVSGTTIRGRPSKF